MGLARNVGALYKSFMRGNYEFGKHISDRLTYDMSPRKARATGTAIDLVAGVGLTGFFGLSTIGSIVTVGTAILGIVAAPATIPAAIGTIAIAALLGGGAALMTGMGVGFLSAAKDKLPTPRAVVVGAGQAVSQGVQTAAKPFRWTAQKLSHPFKRAHDGNKKGPGNPPNAQPRPGHYSL